VLRSKKDLRILDAGPLESLPAAMPLDYRRVRGGLLVESQDELEEDPKKWHVVTKRQPTEEELKTMAFAFKVAKHVKSNAIVLAKGTTLLGMGAGQPSRVDSVEIARKKAGEEAKGSVLASDAMFPFPDGIEVGAQSGAMAVVQPGGSVRDAEVIAMADKYNLAMVFTGARHFRH